MAIVKVYEGDLGQADVQDFVVDALKGGAMGGGAVMLADMAVTKFLPNLSPLVRTLVATALPLGLAIYLKDDNPDVAVGLAIGASAVGAYKLVNMVLAGNAPLSGYDYGYFVPAEDYYYPTDYGKVELEVISKEGEPKVELEAL